MGWRKYVQHDDWMLGAAVLAGGLGLGNYGPGSRSLGFMFVGRRPMFLRAQDRDMRGRRLLRRWLLGSGTLELRGHSRWCRGLTVTPRSGLESQGLPRSRQGLRSAQRQGSKSQPRSRSGSFSSAKSLNPQGSAASHRGEAAFLGGGEDRVQTPNYECFLVPAKLLLSSNLEDSFQGTAMKARELLLVKVCMPDGALSPQIGSAAESKSSLTRFDRGTGQHKEMS